MIATVPLCVLSACGGGPGVHLAANGSSSTAVAPTPSSPPSTVGTFKSLDDDRFTCPHQRAHGLPSRQIPGTATVFVPGRPVHLLACRFHGKNQPQPEGSFAGSATFPPAAIAEALNQATVPNSDPINCPADAGEVIRLRFVDANARILNVGIGTQGCRFASNGDRTVFTPQSVLSTLEATLGHDHF
jgi:hypothetical protein